MYKDSAAVLATDTIVSYTIKYDTNEKYIVKNVSDSGNYVATVTLKDTSNYVFGNSSNNKWTLSSQNTVASATNNNKNFLMILCF